MQSLIPTPDLGTYEELAAAFAAVEATSAKADQAEEMAHEAKSNLCEGPEYLALPPVPDNLSAWDRHQFELRQQRQLADKTRERDRRRVVFFSCKLRVNYCVRLLNAAVTRLMEAVANTREELDRLGKLPRPSADLRFTTDCAMANCFNANALCFSVRIRVRQLDDKWRYCSWEQEKSDGGKELVSLGASEYFAGVCVNFRDALKADYAASAREWIVLYSGHGSQFHLPEGGPQGPFLTKDEAEDDADDWERRACTIGGAAQLYNVRQAR